MPLFQLGAPPLFVPKGNNRSLHWLLAAPHRLFFFLGVVALLLASLWWLVHLWARSGGFVLPMAVPPTWMHAWLMTSGFFPFFLFGFLFTAGPRWLNVPAPSAPALFAPALVAFAGFLLSGIGAQIAAGMVAAGIALTALGWAPLLLRFLQLIRSSTAPNRLHSRLLLCFFGVGWVVQWVFAASIGYASANGVHGAAMLAIWCFLVPIFLTVAHRLFPFFIGAVVPLQRLWNPPWLLAALLGVVFAHALLPLGSVWANAALFDALRLGVDGGGALLLFFLVWRWGIVPAFGQRLVVMLHIGLLWLGIALALYALALATPFLRIDRALLGFAPLHALTMGFFGTLLFAMVTRVTAGHSGRPLVADDFDWRLFWLLQAAVVVRLAGEIVPGTLPYGTLASALLWCVAFVPWAVRKARVYLVPRADGLPG